VTNGPVASGSAASGATTDRPAPTSGDTTDRPAPTVDCPARDGRAVTIGATRPDPAEPRRRLHPLSPLLRGGRLAVLAVAAISWRGLQDLGLERWLAAVALIGVLTLVVSAVSWAFTGYHVVGRELRVYEGLLWRRTRAIPLERLQSVELVRPLLARLTGLAELRLEVVGAHRAEAPLAFLTVHEATALRARLLAVRMAALPAQPAGPDRVGSLAPPGPAGGLSVLAVDNRRLVASQLLRPHWWLIPVAVLAPVFFLVTGRDLGLITIASTITAMIGAALPPVRAIMADWRFTATVGPDGLRLHRGLTETRVQTVPPGRIQAVTVIWPLLWRPAGWVRAVMDIAGVAVRHEETDARARLLPVGTVEDAQRVLGVALPGFWLRGVVVAPVPARAFLLAPIRSAALGYQLNPTVFVTRSGVLTRELRVVPYERIQSVRIRQGPLQRLLRLASVWVDCAGDRVAAVALHRDVREARTLATALADRARWARHPVPAGP
jgi:putative membrane protein